ncbi:hypothetical protein CI109_106614 [Kwoniella shandongensis]|uniref:Translation initiation factor eIF2B subunit gamma n=1 Tax=Kwoniella shandongensis TaxID=1734106 RepID=A0A5M6BQW4_9TREE|nr:uncharacterized protein CI109_007156 [Kwoniella shandongensis]KAA5524501.1 hypothetical protein CI109_007156 [Kwoniella shandongensis]
MSGSFFDPRSGSSKRRGIESQDFTAVILVGHGENLYPFNEGTNVVSKALLPVGNVPIVNSVLDWILAAGIMEILIIVPSTFHSQVAEHVAEHYSMSTHPRARIDIRRPTEGEKDDDEEQSESTGRAGAGLPGREGTARLLKRFRNYIKTDFILLPCDLAPPTSLPLKSILDRHRSSPDAVLTSVFYEPAESVKDSEEKILVALDKQSDELLLIQPLEGMDEELDLRMSLISSHPTLSLTTRLLDAHIYVFRRTVLDLLSTRRTKDLDSMREQVVPWLIKGGWQKGLGERWAHILNPPRKDPLAEALSLSTISVPSFSLLSPGSSPESDHTPLPQTSPGSPASPSSGDESFSAQDQQLPVKVSAKRGSRQGQRMGWKCQVIVTAPEPVEPPVVAKGNKADKYKVVAEPDNLIRANSLAGYWEMNRRYMRTLAANVSGTGKAASAAQPRPVTSNADEATGTAPAISPAAQISPDSLIGEGSRVGERASIKKCIIGRHCNIGKGAKLTGCVLWDFVTVEENARIENTIICSNSRIGEKSQVKDCEFGTGFEAKPGAILKGERLIAGQEA